MPDALRWMRKDSSGVARVLVFGQEEFVEETVHLEQSITVQNECIAIDREKAPVLEGSERLGEALQNVGGEFFVEITNAGPSEF